MRRVVLTVKGRGDVMTVEIWNVGPGEKHLLYDIPFRPGEWSIDLEPSKRDDRGFHRFESVEPRLLRVQSIPESNNTD